MEEPKAQQVLMTLVQEHRLPQVMLFYGREGMPADNLLTWLLPLLLCQGTRKRQTSIAEQNEARKRQGCGECAACHALAHDNHDDVLSYDAAQESFGVAEVSRMQNFFALVGG